MRGCVIMDIPVDLKNALETGNCVLFVGAGIGYNMVDCDGNPIPDGKALARLIAGKFSLPESAEYSLTDVSTFVEIRKNGRKDLINFLRTTLQEASPDDYMQWIPTIKWRAIYTTNYDRAIQKAYDNCSRPMQEYTTITHISEYDDFEHNKVVPIIHLHGSLFEGEDINNIIISQDDYINYAKKKKSLFGLLQQCFVKNCVLFTGYSHNDSNFQSILADISAEVYPNPIRRSYRIDPYTNQINKTILENRHITTLDTTFKDFVVSAKTQLTSKDSVNVSMEEAKSVIPSDFWSILDNAIVPLNRLFYSWDYVNQIHLTGNCDIYNFVRGNKASWDIIMEDRYFPRLIQEDLVLQMLDYATSEKKRVNVCTITGSAGYGLTTLLMIIASKVVKEKMGQAFYLKDGKKLTEGDVFFAYESRKENSKCFFFIDNAADHSNEIKKIILHAKEQNKDIVFVLADRQNELANARMLGSGDLHNIQPLYDSEIEYIIDYLHEYDELNKLKFLKREDQIAAIKVNYSRELLVTIRVATEGKSFDAIIHDEYIGIGDTFSQEAYKLISCLHQFDVQVRMNLLTSLLGVSEIDFYERTRAPLKGVIVFDLYNNDKSIYVVRTRQRYIAQIVWNNCITKAEKGTMIEIILSKINISHYLDRKAFEQFYRSEELIDALPSLESRMRFFNSACSIDPLNPYVRQHFARMLVRNGQEEIALSTVDSAINMDKDIRALHHTKGYILHQMALKSSTFELGRKRMAQSEEAYINTINMNNRDSYGYQGIAELYIDWAKKTPDNDEETLYLSKAEEILTKGLSKVSDKETIWMELSKIDQYLCDTPGQIEKLRKAVSLAPESPMANYLLAKTLSSHQEYEDALKLFKSAFQLHPQNYRNSIEYAKATVLLSNGSEANIKEAIAILQQSTLNGYSDPYFITTLGGLLFLDKQFTEAEGVFQEVQRRELQYMFKPLFDPCCWNINNIFNGTVKYVGGGYSKILIDGYSEVNCTSSKVDDVILQRNMKVNIDLKFNMRGPIAFIHV